jgi:hypothetical protein
MAIGAGLWMHAHMPAIEKFDWGWRLPALSSLVANDPLLRLLHVTFERARDLHAFRPKTLVAESPGDPKGV